MTNFSPEDLILFLYKESSPELTIAIEEALMSDWTLNEKLAVLKASHERLNTLIESPRTATVLNILRYADQTQPVNS
ncbi:MAG: hypothetical protein M3413_11595 [Bacteroidota bacterium]|jgi:hypothetical protein|nr:hypothetical protein [Flavisolibacter sp.]MDQ3552163.1 hypothetical protein [Bacteroidota bacterium]